MNFVGKALPLTEGDKEIVAGYLGCEIAVLNAVIAVESAGKGFGPGNRPIILNEPHILGRELSGSNRDRALREGLATTSSSQNQYPRTQQARYEWLEKAMAINPVAAQRSCSWGLGQVMGFNHEVCGFNNVTDFVRSMMHSEGAQLLAMARFIVGNHLQRHLRSKNWNSFALGYNGRLAIERGYHTKLANAYKRRPVAERRVPPPATEAQLRQLAGYGETPPTLFEKIATPEAAETAGKGGLLFFILAAVGGIIATFFGVLK